MMYGLKWNVVSHSSPASVLCSAFPFFLFFFFRWGSTISSSKKKKKNREHGHYFPTRENCFWLQFLLAIVERLKQEWMYGLSAKKNGRCGEVTVSGGSTVFGNSSECLIQISTTLHNLNLTSTNTEKPNEFSSLQSKGVATKWTLKD